jgi:two-component system, NtrC family, sensor histidine kinase HydH
MPKVMAKRFERIAFPVGTGILIVALASSIWALALRERATKRLFMEYEVYKAITALTDLVRAQALVSEDTKNVLGFGLYATDGSSITRYGNAPGSLQAIEQSTPTVRLTIGAASIVLVRILGGDLPGRRMLPGQERGARMRGSPMPMPMGPPPGMADPQRTLERMPAIAYIDYSVGHLRAEETVIMITAASASVALGALYAVIVVMYGRYRSSKEREAKDKELVELGHAARTIAHEIKNPLGVIRIQCGLLRKGADGATAAGLAVIDDEAMRLADLADRIRVYLKSGEKSASLVVAKEYLEAFAKRYEGVVSIDLELSGDERILIDENRMTEALDNVLANAVEATAPGSEPPGLTARIHQHKLGLAFMDRGPGIPPEHRQRIFEPFFSTKTRGSGLGLALARKNIELSGGAISYSDRPGGGTVMNVTIPLV